MTSVHEKFFIFQRHYMHAHIRLIERFDANAMKARDGQNNVLNLSKRRQKLGAIKTTKFKNI